MRKPVAAVAAEAHPSSFLSFFFWPFCFLGFSGCLFSPLLKKILVAENEEGQ
jgi:hypothetical protein